MTIEPKLGSTVRINLLDVVYGVVIAYGFNFFDQAEVYQDYFRFLFAFAIVLIDWIYVHNLYLNKKYESNYSNYFLILDIVSLFVISRLFASSVAGENPIFWLWLTFLFVLYITWDFILHRNKMDSQSNWRLVISLDLLAALGYLIFYYLFFKHILQTTILTYIFLLLPFFLAVLGWIKKSHRTSEVTDSSHQEI